MSETNVYKTITCEVTSGRACITLNRPEKRNAISDTMQEELHAALWAADEDTRVHSVTLAGNGPDFFAEVGEIGGKYRGCDDERRHLILPAVRRIQVEDWASLHPGASIVIGFLRMPPPAARRYRFRILAG